MTSEERLHQLALDIYSMANDGKCRPDILATEEALILDRIERVLFEVENSGWREGFFHALKAIAGERNDKIL
jgi:hypothetical protein